MGDVTVHVGDAVVARVAAQAARRVPGVVALRADLTQALLGLVMHREQDLLPTDGVHAQVHGTSTDVSITLATRLGHNCRDLAAAVQRAVAADVRSHTGLDAVVRVTISEVLIR